MEEPRHVRAEILPPGTFPYGMDSESSREMLLQLVQNPNLLKDKLSLTQTQAENVAGLVTGGGAFVLRKHLTKYVGAELAGAIGGLLGGYLSRKVLGV